MAAKMVVSLLPLNTPFFKFNLDLLEISEEDKEKAEAVKKGLSVLERETLRDIENTGDVTALNEALKHLLVVGNVGLYVGEKATRLYDLNKYVTLRDADGEVIEAVIEEAVFPDSLPEGFLKVLEDRGIAKKRGATERTVTIYTHIKMSKGRVRWHQEVEGVKVPKSEGDVPEDGNPWLFLRYTRVDGENYGRSHVEMYLGDLQSLETLQSAVNDAAVAASKVIIFVKPLGTTSAKVVAEAPNMSVRSGNAEDITTLQLDKASDMRVAREMIRDISQRLAHAFMLRADVMRDAERVTAEEVRIVAQELDEANGGIYSILSKEFQLPYVKRRIFLLRKRVSLPELPKSVSLAVITGFAALGRTNDAEKLMLFFEKVAAILQNPQIAGLIDLDVVITRLAIAHGVETDGLLLSKDAREARSQAAQSAELTGQLAPELIKQAGPMIAQQLQGEPNDTSNQNPAG